MIEVYNNSFQISNFENFPLIACYVAARALVKMAGTWLGCQMTCQSKHLTHVLPRLILPQAGIAAFEVFIIATVLGSDG